MTFGQHMIELEFTKHVLSFNSNTLSQAAVQPRMEPKHTKLWHAEV